MQTPGGTGEWRGRICSRLLAARCRCVCTPGWVQCTCTVSLSLSVSADWKSSLLFVRSRSRVTRRKDRCAVAEGEARAEAEASAATFSYSSSSFLPFHPYLSTLAHVSASVCICTVLPVDTERQGMPPQAEAEPAGQESFEGGEWLFLSSSSFRCPPLSRGHRVGLAVASLPLYSRGRYRREDSHGSGKPASSLSRSLSLSLSLCGLSAGCTPRVFFFFFFLCPFWWGTEKPSRCSSRLRR